MVKGAKGSLHAVGLWPVTGDGMTTLRCKFDDCCGVLHLLVARVSYNKVGALGIWKRSFCVRTSFVKEKDTAARVCRRSQRFIGAVSTVKCVQAMTF